METLSALLALCVGNSLVTGEFPAQRPAGQSFDVFFDLRLNKGFSKQSWDWWFEMLSHSLWCHCNVIFMVLTDRKNKHIPYTKKILRSFRWTFRWTDLYRKYQFINRLEAWEVTMKEAKVTLSLIGWAQTYNHPVCATTFMRRPVLLGISISKFPP